MEYADSLLGAIRSARQRAALFLKGLEYRSGWKYTAAHDAREGSPGTLYGTWSAVLGLRLLGGVEGIRPIREKARRVLLSYRLQDGTFLPSRLLTIRTNKSKEYLRLHCTNYAIGALIELGEEEPGESRYMNSFLDGDFLTRWLEARSLMRPWEEGNNIVNVAAWLAMMYERGVPGASNRLEQLMQWHRENQNPETGCFDCFAQPTYNQRLQALAGAVHNFHLHLFMGESWGHERTIARSVMNYLWEGVHTACLSIDLVELAIRTLDWSPDPQDTVDSLVMHAEKLLVSQNEDGGWFESADGRTRTVAEGFREPVPSSCSYATWFRLCSLGMIAITLLGDHPSNWSFRRTLGMGYAPRHWPRLPSGVRVRRLPLVSRIAASRERLRAGLRRGLTFVVKKALGQY